LNPQSFRRKLESAIESRDLVTLAELEQIAPENPTTAEIWRMHQQLEGAIGLWREPVSQEPRDVASTPRRGLGMSRVIRATLAASCLFLVYRSLVPDLNFWENDPTAQSVAATESSSWLERWGGRLSLLNSSTDADSPAEPELMAGNSAPQPPISEAGASTENQDGPAESLTTPLVTYSLALADHSQLLLPSRLLPTLPSVSSQLEQGIHATWDTLSTWPQEMQDAWRTFQTPASDDGEWNPEPSSEDHQPSLRRMRGRRTFSWGTPAGSDRFLA